MKTKLTKSSKSLLSLMLAMIICVTAFPIFASAQTVADLQNSVNSYLSKMSSVTTSFVYTNMAPAYTAYSNAVDYIDSVNNGTTPSSAKIKELVSALDSATSSMSKYSTPTTIEGLTQDSTGVSTSIDAQYTQNMLTAVDLATKYEYADGSQNNVNNAILSGSFVWLYDGENTPTAPIGSGAYRNNNQFTKRSIYSIYVDSGDVALGGLGYGGDNDGYWHMSSNTTVDWYYNSSSYSTLGYMVGDSSNTYTPTNRITWYYGSNYIRYIGTPSLSMYYTSFEPIYYGEDNSGNVSQIAASGTIYIINYVPVKNTLFSSSNISKLQNIDSYTVDSATDFVSAYDSLTSIDYTKDDTQSSALQSNENSVSALASLLESSVAKLNAVTLVKKPATQQTTTSATLPLSQTLPEGYTGKTKTQYSAYRIVSGVQSIKVAWTNDTDLEGYQIYISQSKNGTYTKIADVKTKDAQSTVINGLNSKSIYYVKLVGYVVYQNQIVQMEQSKTRAVYVK